MKKLLLTILALALSTSAFATHRYNVKTYCTDETIWKFGSQYTLDDSWKHGDCGAHTVRDFTVIRKERHCQEKGADVASADEITLGDLGDYFDITGTTTINHIDKTGWPEGARVFLQFDASVTVTHNAESPTGTEASILLAGAGDFSATADDTLHLVYDGTTWREISRTVI